ncbi:zf-HC2 domain-containing protein [Amycolatopsis sp. H20-H5]|uniref:zf-HC2 domain-containing protein n=1 Tax=Amycolatopsis sp. H20-H5 TaxID=3046309 RepID=UPI003FA3498F
MEWRAHRGTYRSVEAYVDGELGADASRVVADHLAECVGCRSGATLLVAVKKVLRGTRQPPHLSADTGAVNLYTNCVKSLRCH